MFNISKQYIIISIHPLFFMLGKILSYPCMEKIKKNANTYGIVVLV